MSKTAAHSTAVAPTRADARAASALLVLGAVLLLAGNLAHPVDTDPSATSRLELATGPAWVPIHLVLAAGFLAVTLGLVAFKRVMAPGRGLALAQIGAGAAVIGGVMLVAVFGGLDGYGVAHLAAAWESAGPGDREVIEAAALALEAVDSGLAAIGTAVLLGVAVAAIGAAVVASRVVAPWLGWAALAIGGAGLVTGVLLAVLGPTELTINALLRPTGAAATLLFLTMGIALRRLEPEVPPNPAGTPMPA